MKLHPSAIKLTIDRPSRKPREESLAMRRRNQRNGFWKNSPSRMAFSLRLDIAKERVPRNLHDLTIRRQRDRVLVEKGGFVRAKTNCIGNDLEMIDWIYDGVPLESILECAHS